MLNVEIQAPSNRNGGAALHAINRPIPLKIRLSSQDYDWKQEVERELTTRLHGSPGPLMRASILYRSNRAHVILTFHHSIADALSGVFIIRDLMAALNGYVVLPLPMTRSAEAMLAALPVAAPQEDKQAVPHLDPEELRAIAARDIWRDFSGDRVTVSTMALSEVLTERLREHARANGTTVNGAICAALALHVFERDGAETCTLGNAINVRTTLGVEEECGFFATVSFVDLPRGRRDAFWALARQATEDLVAPRTLAGVSASLDFMAAYITAETPQEIANGIFGSGKSDAFLSNMGKLSIPQTVGCLHLDAFWGPMSQAHRKQECFIGVATLGNRLRLVQTSPDDVPSMLNAIREHLSEAVNSRD